MSAQTKPSLLPKTSSTSELSLLKPNDGTETSPPADSGSNPEGKSILKRNACEICRRRKLRCDGDFPSCGRCTRLNHDCTYNDNRRKTGPRKGYVKGLEARLAQVEGLLAQQGDDEHPGPAFKKDSSKAHQTERFPDDNFNITYVEKKPLVENQKGFPDVVPSQYQTHFDCFPQLLEEDLPGVSLLDEGISWAMIELGVDEPLPPQEVVDELNQLYFIKVHPQVPIIHQYRFLAAMSLAPYARPSAALRYAMWALAASISDKYKHFHSVFYVRSRKYAEADEMTGRFRYINIRHAQAWILIGMYEHKMMHFPHACLTIGRATRLTQIMNLNRLDGLGLDVKQSLPIPADWSEKEERRRTFWMAFCMDRYASVGTGWPMIIDERDIMTNLPSSDEAFIQNLDEEIPGMPFNEALNPSNASNLSAFAGVVIICSLIGRNLHHLQRPSPQNDDHDVNGEFWKEHRKLENMLLNILLCLPSHLRLPAGLSDPNKIFLNMGLHSVIITLHQAAIFKAEKLGLSSSIILESRTRCIGAAAEICSIMKMSAHMDLTMFNVYSPFALYLSARIFAQASKRDPEDDSAKSSVRFLLAALVALKDTIPMAESYLMQLDIEGCGLAALQDNVKWFGGLEKGVAEMSIKEEVDEASWVTFVSPLVRIVERKEDSLSPSAMSSHDPQATPGCDSSLDIAGAASSATIPSSSENCFEGPLDISMERMDNLKPLEGWEMNETDLLAETFDPLMDMEHHDWS